MWPDEQLKFIPQALCASVMRLAAKDAEPLSHSDNFWVSKESILAGPETCRTPTELAIHLLYQQHVQQHLPDNWQGAEYWVQVYEPGKGLGFHFDKDEHVMRSQGKMLNPLWSSVLYLTGSTEPAAAAAADCSNGNGNSSSYGQTDCSCEGGEAGGAAAAGDAAAAVDDWDGVRQAPTVILQQVYDTELCTSVPESAAASVVVWPQRGSYCLFDGRLAHGVLDSCSSSLRATLLVNWWAQRPQAVGDLPEDLEQLQLTQLDASSIQQALQCTSLQQPHQQQQQQQQQQSTDASAVANDAETVAAALGGLSCTDDPAASSNGQQQQQQQQLPCLLVAEVEGDESSAVQLVDAVIAKSNLTLIGPSAVSAVAFEHPGFNLYPMEPPEGEEAEAAAAEQAPFGGKTQTLAAFVSDEVMGDGEGESSEEDEQ